MANHTEQRGMIRRIAQRQTVLLACRTLVVVVLLLALVSNGLANADSLDESDDAYPEERPIMVMEDVSYDPPYSQYSDVVAHVLDEYGTMEEAFWLVELGLAHRHAWDGLADDDPSRSNDPDAPVVPPAWHTTRAMAVLRQAMVLLEPQIHDVSLDHITVDDVPPLALTAEQVERLYHYATASYNLAETVALSYDIVDDSIIQQQTRYQVAHDMFQTLLRIPVTDDPASMEPHRLWNAETRHECRVNWAHASLRLGVMLLSSPSDSHDPFVAEPGERAQHAITYFTQAVDTFEPLAGSSTSTEREAPDTQRQQQQRHYANYWATSLYNLGTAWVLVGDLERAVTHLETAWTVYARSMDDTDDATDTVQAVSELLMTLADASLQLGRYPAAKDWYRQCMEWYETHQVDPRLDDVVDTLYDDETTATLSEYEVALQEYLESIVGTEHVSMELDDYMGEAVYGRDHAYEGDLHLNIGSLYLSHSSSSGNNDITALSHLEQAMRLYELAGEGRSESMATAQYTVSMYHLRMGHYAESAQYYGQALDLLEHVAEVHGPVVLGTTHSLPLVGAAARTSVTHVRTDASEPDASHDPPSAIHAVAVGPNGPGQKGSTILVDVTQFLKQNDSAKDEL